MAVPQLPTLVGGGAIISTVIGILGFVLAVRTQFTAAQLALCVGGLASLALISFILSATVQTAVTIFAYIIMLGFPLYALFWVLHDFVERVVHA